jgi:hypothetical protein
VNRVEIKMADERCIHDLTASQCGTCKPRPPGVPRLVWITEGGDAFHLRPTCEALLSWQGRAEHRGQGTHEPENVACTTARAVVRDACQRCFPRQIPADARPCLVRVDGSWTEGWVLDAFKDDDQRWKGAVVYNNMELGEQVTTIKDERDLRPCLKAPATDRSATAGSNPPLACALLAYATVFASMLPCAIILRGVWRGRLSDKNIDVREQRIRFGAAAITSILIGPGAGSL